MPNHHAVCTAGKPAIGDQTDRITQPCPDDCRGRRQHLAHTRATLGSLITDHHDITRLDPVRKHRFHARLFGFEYTCRPGDLVQLDAGDLCHCAFFREIAFQNCEVSLRVDRIVPRTYHILILARDFRDVLQYFRYRLTGDGERIAMQHAMNEQHLHHLRNTAGLVQIGRDIFS